MVEVLADNYVVQLVLLPLYWRSLVLHVCFVVQSVPHGMLQMHVDHATNGRQAYPAAKVH